MIASTFLAIKVTKAAVKRLKHGVKKPESKLAPGKCTLQWNHAGPVKVGTVSELTLKLVRENDAAYTLKAGDTFSCEVKATATGGIIQHTVQPSFLVGQMYIKIVFTATLSGTYSVEKKINNVTVGGIATKIYTGGEMDLMRSKLINVAEPKIVTANNWFLIHLLARDCYGNAACVSDKLFEVDIRKNSHDGQHIANIPLTLSQKSSDRYQLRMKLPESGYYFASIKYGGRPMHPQNLAILCLTEKEDQLVRMNIATRERHACFNAEMISGARTEDVNCRISPQTLEVQRHRRFGIISRQPYVCKISASRKITLHAEPDKFTVDNRKQDPILLSSTNRNVIAAMFYKFQLRNVGGSEDFEKKQQYLGDQLRLHHHLGARDKERGSITIHVKRDDMLRTAMEATKNFRPSDWLKRFSVEFDSEIGSDYGGLCREFVELLSEALFHKHDGSGPFVRLDSESQQAPVHPNHRNLDLKQQEFAGKLVGKCLLESTVFDNPLLVKANFTKSCLAQLLGLNVSYTHYEVDDPVYFRHKIKYTLENDIKDIELFFTDTSENEVPLIKKGQRRRVTEENKEEYLNALADFRLAKRPGKQIKHFIKGLTMLIPQDLLMIFTENELQLLMCGIDDINLQDMKRHTDVCDAKSFSADTVAWFWEIVKQFSQEERGMLLKFVTGSSRLPLGGFKSLLPHFTIFMIHDKKRLPSAHACTNQLNLPEFESCEKLYTALMMAITEAEHFHNY